MVSQETYKRRRSIALVLMAVGASMFVPGIILLNELWDARETDAFTLAVFLVSTGGALAITGLMLLLLAKQEWNGWG